MGRTTIYHQNLTSEEKLNRVNPNNMALLKDFLSYMRTIDRSPQSLKNYTNDIKIFYCWLLENARNKDFTAITKRDIMNYQDWILNDLGLSPSRIRCLKSALSSMSIFIETILDDEYPTFRNIVNKIKPPVKRAVREKTVLSEKQVETLLDSLVNEGEYQKAFAVACLSASGVRKAELIQFKASFFRDEVIVYGMYKTPKIRCKGEGVAGKQMNKFIAKEIVVKYLDLWIKERERLGVDIDDMFVVKRNGVWQPAKKSTVNSWMNKFTTILDVPVYCHCFRHYLATWLKRKGIEIDKIRDLLGHQSSATSEIYIDIESEENMEGMFDFLDKNGNVKDADDTEEADEADDTEEAYE